MLRNRLYITTRHKRKDEWLAVGVTMINGEELFRRAPSVAIRFTPLVDQDKSALDALFAEFIPGLIYVASNLRHETVM